MTWYTEWLSRQIDEIPYCLREIFGPISKSHSTLSNNLKLIKIFMKINEMMREEDGPRSIDEISDTLDGLATSEPQYLLPNNQGAKRLLVFALLGWQSMLYNPSFNTCDLSQLAVVECPDSQPYAGMVYDTPRLPADLADRPMAILLKTFGSLLPAQVRASGLFDEQKESGALSSSLIGSHEMNAHVLRVLLHVDVCWVDSLSLHLDYNKPTRTLYLFRYPSFCVANLLNGGTIYSFASTETEAADPRGDHEDITNLLRETLLSYRLLFGQLSSSRRLFRHMSSTDPTLFQNADPLLRSLCTKEFLNQQLFCQDRATYSLDRDFPILGDRIALLKKELKAARPKGWRDLVRDRRDAAQYWTFWLVAIFGAMSIVLAALQVALAAAQLAKS